MTSTVIKRGIYGYLSVCFPLSFGPGGTYAFEMYSRISTEQGTEPVALEPVAHYVSPRETRDHTIDIHPYHMRNSNPSDNSMNSEKTAKVNWRGSELRQRLLGSPTADIPINSMSTMSNVKATSIVNESDKSSEKDRDFSVAENDDFSVAENDDSSGENDDFSGENDDFSGENDDFSGEKEESSLPKERLANEVTGRGLTPSPGPHLIALSTISSPSLAPSLPSLPDTPSLPLLDEIASDLDETSKTFPELSLWNGNGNSPSSQTENYPAHLKRPDINAFDIDKYEVGAKYDPLRRSSSSSDPYRRLDRPFNLDPAEERHDSISTDVDFVYSSSNKKAGGSGWCSWFTNPFRKCLSGGARRRNRNPDMNQPQGYTALAGDPYDDGILTAADLEAAIREKKRRTQQFPDAVQTGNYHCGIVPIIIIILII